MSELRFDGRVAIVTGAGGNPGLGRSYARLLASRGAAVVVNDLGSAPGRRGTNDNAAADLVVSEIRNAGGTAIADTHSVATEEGAQAVVATAIDAYGKVDILVNNASIAFFAGTDEMSSADVHAQIDVHFLGTIWMCRAVWPYMREAGYGRIVNTTSKGMVGAPNASVYGAVKGGIFSLTRGLAAEGAAHGIRCNSLSPEAMTRVVQMTHEENSPQLERMKLSTPELVAPAMIFLAHEDCPVMGENLVAGGGHVARMVLTETAGYADAGLTLESVRDNFDRIMDPTDANVVEIRFPDTSASHRQYKN